MRRRSFAPLVASALKDVTIRTFDYSTSPGVLADAACAAELRGTQDVFQGQAGGAGRLI